MNLKLDPKGALALDGDWAPVLALDGDLVAPPAHGDGRAGTAVLPVGHLGGGAVGLRGPVPQDRLHPEAARALNI